ncbi:MAG: phosphate/phosphite/phosphonate ABC transporter substrate-binding protein [Deferribacteres bacterium]|nr:phosphate/phosphite/phosphonate ABC transporter substrate-binding protein [Deferribacteres bacterium]
MINRLFSVFIILSFIMISGCSGDEAPKKVSLYKREGGVSRETDYPQQNTIWFGFDPGLGPKEEVMIYTPFLKYLEKTTGKRFRIKFTTKYEDTVENLGRGVTDFAAIGALKYVIGKDEYGIRYLVSGLNREGFPTYHTMIFTRADSNIESIKDIKGKCFAFGDRMSAQGHFIPRKMLSNAGITLDDLGKYVYTGSLTNAVKAVLNGECDAGGIRDSLAKRLASEGKIKILKVSGAYPAVLIAYNSNVDGKIVEAVKSALLSFDPMGKDRDMLFDWDRTEMPGGFTEIKEPGLEKVKALAMEYGLLKK